MSSAKDAPKPPEPESKTNTKKPIEPKAVDADVSADKTADETVFKINESIKAMESELASEETDKATQEAEVSSAEVSDTAQVEEVKTAEPENDSPLDDPETDRAIDEILAEEGDAVLAAEDLERDLEAVSEEDEHGRLANWWAGVWGNPRWRWAFICSFMAGLLAIGIFPPSRYFVLNTVGVRSSLSLRVVDGSTMQPLKNVTVRAGGATAQTDSDGNTNLGNVRLGKTILQIEKRAFSPVDQAVTVGWGSNPLGEFRVSAVGTQYTFYIKDFLSGKPIEKAEATSGDGNAASDQDGKLVLTLDTSDQDDSAQIKVEISAGLYRTETVEFGVNNKEEQGINLVPGRKHVYVSKRSGRYDVYTAYVDGKDEQKIVEGTGLEKDDIALIPHQKDGVAALVSTRERVMDSNGYLLSTLYVMDTQSGSLVKIDQSEQIKVVGWADDGHLVYVKIAAGASGTDPKRHRLMSFNSKDFADTKELASSNAFNDVLMANGRIYFAPSNIFQEVPNPAMFAVNPDGSGQQTIVDKEVFTIVRNSYETLELNTNPVWYSFALGSAESAKVGSEPAVQGSRMYTDNAANDFSLWVDSRDGKGVLLNYDTRAKTEGTLVSRNGLRLPVYWLNDKYVIFRVSDSKETADYVLNTEGGEPRKITDVTNTAGISRWFYY